MATPHTFSLALPSDFKSYEVKFSVNQVTDEFDEKAPLKVSQKLLKEESIPTPAAATPAAIAPAKKCPFISMGVPADFQIHEVDKKFDPRVTQPVTTQPAPLGVLSNFAGPFAGKGMNLIFRPNSGPPTTTTFPKPVTPAPPAVPSENVLEINLTTETLTFSNPLGRVPNRGLQEQNDIFLNGVPYVQVVNDVTNINTGKADGPATPIHFEPGLWMHIPATTNDPVNAESLVRMASIPHGTTINAQLLNPTITINGPPSIPSVDITPFKIGFTQTTGPIKFASQTAANDDTPRLPQDLTKFIAAGTITQDILTDPNTVLRNAIKGQKITKTIIFVVGTTPTSPEQGGGTANIAFLEGAPVSTTSKTQTGPNANAVSMQAVFWIEAVQHTIVVPPFKPGQAPLRLKPTSTLPDAHVPTFEVNPPHEITAPKTIVVESTQIQYSQTVILNFANLSWPHVSVATLVPSEAQPVPPTVWN